MEVALGPLLYYWPRKETLAFYEKVTESVFDRVYLGEVICAKRRQLKLEDWVAIGKKLQSAGKKVILSSMTLLESESDLSQVKRVCENGQFCVEANDMSAVHFLSSAGLPFYTGPSVNIYNGYTLEVLSHLGLKGWVLPVELSRNHLVKILEQASELGVNDLETEVFSYGYMPLAYSARCFTARSKGLAKDQCEFACIKTPEGIPLATQEGEKLFTINGIQTMSGHCLNLLDQWQDMQKIGVSTVRLSAHSHDVFEVAKNMPCNLNIDGEKAGFISSDSCNGYWFEKSPRQ